MNDLTGYYVCTWASECRKRCGHKNPHTFKKDSCNTLKCNGNCQLIDEIAPDRNPTRYDIALNQRDKQ